MSSLLLDDRPLQVLPKLAIRIGLNEAIVLQQLHWLLQGPTNGRKIAEHKWIFNTVDEWRAQYFQFWSNRTIKTIFANLSRMGLIETCQPEGRLSRRKYYRVNLDQVQRISDGAKFVPSKGQQSSVGNGQNSSLPDTETPSETSKQRKSKESEETANGFAVGVLSEEEEEFSALWKPDERTKAAKLKAIRAPRDFPTEREFHDFIEISELDKLLMSRDTDEIYRVLCCHKWRQWRGNQWVRIVDWRAYVTGLNRKMEDASGN